MFFSFLYFLLLLVTHTKNGHTTINAVTTSTASNKGTADDGVGVSVGTGVGDGVIRTSRTMFTVVVSLCDSPSSASTVYSPVNASEVVKVVWILPFSTGANFVPRSVGPVTWTIRHQRRGLETSRRHLLTVMVRSRSGIKIKSVQRL